MNIREVSSHRYKRALLVFSPLPLLGEGSGVRVLSERRKNPPLQPWLEGERATLQNGLLERVTPEEFVTDALFSGLRLKRGVNLNDLSSRSGTDVSQRFADALVSLQSRGLLERDGDVVRATHDGIWVLNQVVAEFL
jgi:coproporphyrinogen III oxidase-like Fe-S oxidoreductase